MVDNSNGPLIIFNVAVHNGLASEWKLARTSFYSLRKLSLKFFKISLDSNVLFKISLDSNVLFLA